MNNSDYIIRSRGSCRRSAPIDATPARPIYLLTFSIPLIYLGDRNKGGRYGREKLGKTDQNYPGALVKLIALEQKFMDETAPPEKKPETI